MLDDAETRYALASALLARGDYARGWPLYEARVEWLGDKLLQPGPHYPKWDGGPVQSLLLFPEQGLGDQIMFSRYLPELKACGIAVTILCSSHLVRLFQQFGVPVIGASGEVSVPRHAAWCLVGSLPLLIGTIPSGPYLSAAGSGGGVGVMATGRSDHPNDAHRSLGPAESDRLRCLGRNLHPDATGARDMQDTAEIIAGLDLVISVDTSVAHLAGAMGKRTWILLPKHRPDWRWGLTGERSLWYPSMRLFRQERVGEWAPVLDQVAARMK